MNELNPQSSVNARAVGPDREVEAKARVEKPSTEQRDGKGLPVNQREAASVESAEPVDQAVTALNDYVQSLQRDLKFTVDPELGRPVVSVVDSNTQQVIRQIPNDVAIRLARNLKDAGLESAASGAATEGYGSAGAQVSQTLNLINTKI